VELAFEAVNWTNNLIFKAVQQFSCSLFVLLYMSKNWE